MTTPYDIKVSPAALRQILAMSQKYQKLLLKLIEALAVNPRPPGVKRIDGMTGLYSEAVSPFRIIYKVEEHEILILLIR